MSKEDNSEIFRYLRRFDNRLDKVQGYLQERSENALTWDLEVRRLDRKIEKLEARLAVLERKLETG